MSWRSARASFRKLSALALACATAGCAAPSVAPASELESTRTAGGEAPFRETSYGETPSSPARTALSAQASGPTGQAAAAAAADELLGRLLGEWAVGRIFTLPAPDLTADEAGGFTATITFDEAGAASFLKELRRQMPFATGLPPALLALQRAALQQRACALMRVDAQVDAATDCVPEAWERLVAEARAEAEGLRVRPAYLGGYPVDARGGALRDPEVVVERATQNGSYVPVAGIPISVVTADDAVHQLATTDANGRVRYDVGAHPGSTAVASLAGQAVAPAVAALLPQQRVPLDQRPIDLQRWTLVLVNNQSQNPSARSAFSTGLDQALTARGAQHMVPLEDPMRQRLVQARSNRSTVLAELADAQAGRIDVVVFAAVESAFASRMGTRRVWFESKATVSAYVAWTGQSLGSFEEVATAHGIGEERAEAESRNALAVRVAERLTTLEAIRIGRDEPLAAVVRLSPRAAVTAR